MSIGKRLLELRQRKGLSQEELANQLHVSRQTISKWESDLSLPDMKMMLEIAEFYGVSITDLLGVDESKGQDSVEHLYEQTSLVLENIQSETKKRHQRDMFVMGGICFACILLIVVTVFLFVKVSDLQNTTFIEHTYTNETETKRIIDSFTTNDQDIIVDLSKQLMKVNFVCSLREYRNDTTVKIKLVNNNGKVYEYDMKKKDEGTFVYNDSIPFENYESMKVILTNKDGVSTMEDIPMSTSLSFLSDILANHLVNLEIPKDKNYKIIKNQMIISTNYQDSYIGKLNGKVYIQVSDAKGESVFYDGVISLGENNEKQTVTFNKNISLGITLKVKVRIVVGDEEVEMEREKKILENTNIADGINLIDY